MAVNYFKGTQSLKAKRPLVHLSRINEVSALCDRHTLIRRVSGRLPVTCGKCLKVAELICEVDGVEVTF